MKRIFVSSTFKDMHEERDILHYRVLPALNEYAKTTYGETLEFSDLRWGINTSELNDKESSLRVLSVCLDEVERCKPYMIVILGDRYGSIPDEQLIIETVKKRDHFLLHDLKKSITALEIEYGALQNKNQLSRTLFYFRTIEGNCPSFYRPNSEEDHLLQEQLKSTIRYLAPDNVKEYTIYWNEESKQLENLDAFESMLTNDIKRLLEKEWQESAKMSPAQKLFYLHQDFACHKSSIFGGRNWFLDRCLWHLNNGTRQILIYGETGSGKTTALGALFSFLQKSGWQTLPFFTGIHGHTDTSSSLFNYLIWQIEELTRESHQTDGHTFSASLNEKIQYLNSLITKYTQMKTMPLAILIDNADSLNCLQQLFSLSSHKVAILCSSSSCYHERNMDVKTIELYSFGKRKKDSIPDFLKPFHLGLKEQLESSNPFAQDDGVIPDDASQHLAYELENLFEAGIPDDDILLEKKAVIEGILRYHKKELDSRVINAIVEKNEADTPLYLSILIQRLIMMDRKDFYKISELGDGIDNITAYQLQLIQDVSLTTSQLCVWLMNAAIEKIGNPALKDALYFLSITHVGLCENDLESLILLKYNSWNALDFTLFIRYMGVAFIQYNDGRYTFANDMLRKGFLQDCENIADFHKILLEYIKTLPSEHSLRTKESIIHCYMANDKEFFLQHLTEYQHNSTSHIFTMEDLCHLLQNGSFLHSEPDIYHWVAKSFEAAESKAQCLMLIRYLAPYAKQVFFQDNMFDHTLPLFESLVKLAEKSTDVYHISWMLTVYAENILNHRSDFCVPMPDGSIPTPLINAKEACLKAAELLSQEPTHSDELTQCYALGGEIAAVSGLYSEAFQFFEHAEYYSRQYTNIEKQKELIAHFLENQGDMLLFTCEPSNKLLALQKYQAVQADIERETRILAKCYLCVSDDSESKTALVKKANLWKLHMRNSYGTQVSMKFLWQIIQAECNLWKYKDFHDYTNHLLSAVDALFHLRVDDYHDLCLFEDPLLERESTIILENAHGKTLCLPVADWLELEDKEYLVTYGTLMGNYTDSLWFWQVEDTSNPHYRLVFTRVKNRVLLNMLNKLVKHRMLNAESVMSQAIIQFRAGELKYNVKSKFSLSAKWYYK